MYLLMCKPGGYGVIWKLAYDKGVFQWFYDHGRKGATVRQVSNVVAATDLSLLALAGIGLQHGKKLGFASCKRNSGATEGINVLMEKKKLDGRWAYGLSCIEYTEFDKYGITTGPHSHNSYAEFPANTNILYVDLPSAELVGSSKNTNSLPGMVLNVKKAITFIDNFGNPHSVPGGRLECTMQILLTTFLIHIPLEIIIALKISLIHLLSSIKEDGLHHLLRRKEGRQTSRYTKYNVVVHSWQLAFNWDQGVDFQVQDVRARVLTDMAWVTVHAYVGEHLDTGPFSVTNIFEFHNGRWYIVHHHNSVLDEVGRLHCLLPWWKDAIVSFMSSGGYNGVAQIKQGMKNGYIAIMSLFKS